MKILAALMEFLSNKATRCTKKLLTQLRIAGTDLKIIHDILQQRKVKIDFGKAQIEFVEIIE